MKQQKAGKADGAKQKAKRPEAAASSSSVTIQEAYVDRINLKNVQRYDPAAVSILDKASHMVLYQYEEEGTSQWRKLEVEGPCFLLYRSKAPHYALFLMNRCHPKNFIHYLTEETSVHWSDRLLLLQRPYETFGVWFHAQEEKTAMYQHLVALTPTPREEEPLEEPAMMANHISLTPAQLLQTASPSPPKPPMPPSTVHYNPSVPPTIAERAPTGLGVTSTVMDIFRQASAAKRGQHAPPSAQALALRSHPPHPSDMMHAPPDALPVNRATPLSILSGHKKELLQRLAPVKSAPAALAPSVANLFSSFE